jgi:hypothetical protein
METGTNQATKVSAAGCLASREFLGRLQRTLGIPLHLALGLAGSEATNKQQTNDQDQISHDKQPFRKRPETN